MKYLSYFIGLILLSPLGAFAQAETETFEFKPEQVISLNVHNSMGRVDIAAAMTDKVGIVAEKTRWGKRCLLKVNLDAGVLNVISDDQNWILDTECRVDFILSVPEKVKTLVRVGLGDVNVVGLKGDVDVKI